MIGKTVIINFPEVQIKKETEIGLPQGNKKGFAANVFNFFFQLPKLSGAAYQYHGHKYTVVAK